MEVETGEPSTAVETTSAVSTPAPLPQRKPREKMAETSPMPSTSGIKATVGFVWKKDFLSDGTGRKKGVWALWPYRQQRAAEMEEV